MKNVVLDTCVFFGMLMYYKIYKEHGEQALCEVLEIREREAEKLRIEVENKYGIVFKEKYKDYAFEEAVEHVKEVYNGNKKNLEKRIASLEIVAKGEDPKTRQSTIPLARQLEVREIKLPSLIAEYQEYCAKVDSDVISLYKNMSNSIENGRLLLSVIRGEIKPFLVPPGFDEVLDHTQPKNDNPKWKVVDKKLVDGMLEDFVTLISTNSDQFLEDVKKLAEKLREPAKNNTSKEMAQDLNANEVFGDSLIMAWANMVGMPLVTQNIKDFIRDITIKPKNERKRKNIAERTKDVDYATDALPYSTREILDGKFNEPTRKNSVYELSETTALDYNYSIPRMKGSRHVPSAKLMKEQEK